MTADFTQSCVREVNHGFPRRWRRLHVRQYTPSRAPIPDTRTTTPWCRRRNSRTCLATSSSRSCLEAALRRAGTMHGGQGWIHCAASDPSNGYVCKVSLPSPSPSKMRTSHSTAWKASIRVVPYALACGTPRYPSIPATSGLPSPTTMEPTNDLPLASYTAVGFITPGGALCTAGEPYRSSISGRGSAALTAVKAFNVERLGDPRLGALSGVEGASPRGDSARDAALPDD